MQHVVLEQLGVELCHAVDGMAADTGQVRHPHIASAAFIDEGHPGHPGIIPWVPGLDFIEKAPVDFIDDFKVPGQQSGEEIHRPLLEGLREQGVIGVGEGGAGDFPRCIPVHFVFVDQEPHQLSDTQGWVGVVELDGEAPGESAQVAVDQLVQMQHVLERAGNEKILLFQPQLLTLDGFIVGVEHFRDVFREDLLVYGPIIVAYIEGLEFEGFNGFRLPKPQQVTGVHPVSQDGSVVGDPFHRPVRKPANLVAAPIILIRFGSPPKAHLVENLRTCNLPGVAQVKPLVGMFHLPPIANFLVEDAEFVADPVPDGRDLQSRQGIKITGRQPAQPAVAEAGFLLLLEEGLNIETFLLCRPADPVVDAEVDQVVFQMRAEKKFCRKITDNPDIRSSQLLDGLDPAMQELVPHGVGHRHVEVVPGGYLRESALGVEDVFTKGASHALEAQIGATAGTPFCRWLFGLAFLHHVGAPYAHSRVAGLTLQVTASGNHPIRFLHFAECCVQRTEQ